MTKITIAPLGSLGDLHPLLALGIELRKRGHEVTIATSEVYQEKIDILGFPFFPMRPNFDPDDREFARKTMDMKGGSEFVVKDVMNKHVSEMYSDLAQACKNTEVLISGDLVFASFPVAEKLGLKHITTTLAPLPMFSVCEGSFYPNAPVLYSLDFLGRPYRTLVKTVMEKVSRGWLDNYRKLRVGLNLDPNHDPLVRDKFSKLLHLAMFSSVLGKPQPDWTSSTVQTGFCFYDGDKDQGIMPPELEEFLRNGEPPIVFTLGSAAVMSPGKFFEESVKAAKILGRRAVLVYGTYNDAPSGLDEERMGVDYAPFSRLFPHASCVVHQGGVGTTGQVLRAGVPHLFMPYSHDQPDNALRVKRLGAAEIISRDNYTAENAVRELHKILDQKTYAIYKANAEAAKSIVDSERGTKFACDEIERILD